MIRLTPAEVQALALVADGQSVARPVRKRLHQYGLLDEGKLTHTAWKLLEESAPRSRWEPPKQQGPATADPIVKRMNPRASTALLAAAMLSLPITRK